MSGRCLEAAEAATAKPNLTTIALYKKRGEESLNMFKVRLLCVSRSMLIVFFKVRLMLNVCFKVRLMLTVCMMVEVDNFCFKVRLMKSVCFKVRLMTCFNVTCCGLCVWLILTVWFKVRIMLTECFKVRCVYRSTLNIVLIVAFLDAEHLMTLYRPLLNSYLLLLLSVASGLYLYFYRPC